MAVRPTPRLTVDINPEAKFSFYLKDFNLLIINLLTYHNKYYMQRAKNLHSLDLFISLIHFENMNKRAAHQNITYIGWISVSAWVSSEGGRLVAGWRD